MVSYVFAGSRRSQWSSGEFVGAKVGVPGSPIDLCPVEMQKRSSAWLCEGWPAEGGAWRSPPSNTAAWGKSSVSVLLSHSSASLYVLLPWVVLYRGMHREIAMILEPAFGVSRAIAM